MATWTFDSAHTSAAFSARHMMMTTVRGQFDKVTGTLEFDPQNPAAASVEATIDTSTISTGVVDRDNHLKSADFLDIANFPTLTFKSTKVEIKNDNNAKVTGDLTIRGTTRPVVIDAEFFGQFKDLYGNQKVGFSGKTKINREDWNLTWNVALETGGWLVGKDITIELDLQAVLVTESVNA